MADIRLGLRSFRRTPQFALGVCGTVALAVGINVVAFGSLRAVMFGDRPFRDADRLVQVSQTGPRLKPSGFSTTGFEALAELPAFDSVAAITETSTLVRGAAAPEYLTVGHVTEGFFKVFDGAVASGRALDRSDFVNPAEPAVISHAVWSRQFHRDEKVVGRPFRVGTEIRTIIGVMAQGFETGFPDQNQSTIWIPKIAREQQAMLSVFARLTPSADMGLATTQVRAAIAPIQALHPPIVLAGGVTYNIDDVLLEHLWDRDAAAARPGLVTFQALAVLLFAMAAANLANMFLARTLNRRRELGTRTALGAARWRIVLQLLVEGGLLAAIGAAAGLLVASWTLPVLYAESTVLPRAAQPGVSAPETLVAIGAAALLALLFAGIPAFLLTRRDPLSLMRGDFARSGPRFARSSLVATQVALGVIVLVGAGLLIRSFVRVINVPLGFDAEGLTVAELRMPPGGGGEQATAFLQKAQMFLTTELGTQPFALGRMPFAGVTSTRNWTLGAQPFDFDRSFGAETRLVTASYFDTLGIAVRTGRGFSTADTPVSLPVAVVSEAFARRHGRQQNVVGNVLRTDRREYHIIGIVDDVRASRLAIAPSPAVYTLLEQQPSSNFAIAVRSSNVRAVGDVVGRLAAALGPDVVVSHVTAATDRITRSEARRRFFVFLLSALAVLAAALSAIGIVGVMATTLAARRRELAIRLAIGGTPRRVKLAAARAGLVPVVAGVAGGSFGAWALARWAVASDAIQSQLYQTSARDPLTLALSAALLLVVGAAACWLPARQAAAINPMVVLKSE